MRGWRGVALIVGSVAALSGCYRSARLPPAELKAMSPEGDGLRIERTKGPPLFYESYESVEVETFDDTGYELENPVSLQREPQMFVVTDPNAERRFWIDEVEAIKLQEAAPERPWIVAGIATGSMFLLGFLGANVVDCDYGCAEEQLAGAFFGGVIGLGSGVAIGVAATSKLSPTRSEPGTER